MDIKEESYFSDLCSENEPDTKDLGKKVKIETVTSSSDTKPELEDSTRCSQNEEHDLTRFNETIKDSETDSKIDIKEENWWLDRDDSCINDIKNETHEDFYSTKLPRLCKDDVTSYTRDLFSSEYLGSDISMNMNQDSAECQSARKCPSAKSVVTYTSSIETSVCSKISDDGKIAIMTKHIKPYKCIICNKGFMHLQHLKTHKLIHEGIKPHKCKICNKDFTDLSNLKRHNLIHEGLKPHKCNICNKGFIAVSHLKRHKLIHEGIKLYKCNICNKSFMYLQHLKTHKLIHESIKPQKCNICNKDFTDISNLKKHKLIHEGIKPHKCKICNRAFTDLSNLKKHKLIHEGIKPHKCIDCNKAFTELSNLKRHKVVHEDNTCKSSICNKAFTHLQHLKTN